MLTATPGENITLTWPRTANPDGTAADGSDTVWVYYNPDASINEGKFGLMSSLFDHVFVLICRKLASDTACDSHIGGHCCQWQPHHLGPDTGINKGESNL